MCTLYIYENIRERIVYVSNNMIACNNNRVFLKFEKNWRKIIYNQHQLKFNLWKACHRSQSELLDNKQPVNCSQV